MYEISLVPDIKAQLLNKQRLRNLIFLICIGVAVACGVIVFILFSILTGQNISISNQENEIACRYDERGKPNQNLKCDRSKTKTPIMKFNNMETLLTIQDQMKNMDTLNNSRIKFSRIFGLLDVLLINEEHGQEVDISELNADFSTMTLSFDAVGYDHSTSSIGYKPLETFKKNAEKMYYDFGDYYRTEDGSEVKIPSYCMSETMIKGQLYGVYHKGKAGCEKAMVDKSELGDDESNEDSDDGSEDNETNKEENTEESTADEEEVTDIYIRRSYEDSNDRNDVKDGKDKYWDEELMGKNSDYKGFVFRSECLQYDESDGRFDESTTIETCPFLSDEESGIEISNSSYGRDSNDEMVLSFKASVPVSDAIFLAVNHHMRIIGPSRQNVTDSYVQIRDMFTSGIIEKEGN